MFERIKRFFGNLGTRSETGSAGTRLVELDRKATDREAFRAAFEEGDFERAADYHEFSAEELRATVEDTLGAVTGGDVTVGEGGIDVEGGDGGSDGAGVGGFGGDGGGGGGE